MKLYKFSFLMLSALFTLSSCNDIDEQKPLDGSLTGSQVQETNLAIPERADATFNGLFSMMAKPNAIYKKSSDIRPDDCGFYCILLSNDLEAADMTSPNNDYNWFSTACELSSRDANYANPYIRYKTPYNQIGVANEIIAGYPAGTTDSLACNRIAQAKAMRAYDYMTLLSNFAFVNNPEALSIPILKDGVDFTNNPRAAVKDVLAYVLEDLNYAVEHLVRDSKRNKAYIDLSVALGLRARANLLAGNYPEAADDAEKAMQGYTPASIEEVSTPAFMSLDEHNWMWGIEITKALSDLGSNSTISAWTVSFSADSYSAALQCYMMINKLLWNKIPSTDVRKGWWVDENLESPLLNTITWNDATGKDISTLQIEDVKEAFLPYTNVKFGQKSGIGSDVNINDIPLMRVEEMYLIQAEGLAKSGNTAKAKQVLTDFVKTYRDPSYAYDEATSPRSLADEIWFQRRVELWGEGFATADTKRLGKPVVRTHGDKTTNCPDAFSFNIKADDGWLNMRFPTAEKNYNAAIVDNEGGAQPVSGQNATLRDGVTD